VILLDVGLILVPTPKKNENGRLRMNSLLQSGSVVQLASYRQVAAPPLTACNHVRALTKSGSVVPTCTVGSTASARG
jgi:hypothetical protein